jgi:hypothetical protein
MFNMNLLPLDFCVVTIKFASASKLKSKEKRIAVILLLECPVATRFAQ